ncbi:hypothetical protein BpHYR1_046937 [Brachionus plicatilis]|uniref:Uncharacterized protein n=1 Tax=Brachionus plicatilis TaxID=10195 RepID=A0A3M7RH23_BRAPC|nr:hypothetical protein BpHYR1_046937 [Brachionus plicatilis]
MYYKLFTVIIFNAIKSSPIEFECDTCASIHELCILKILILIHRVTDIKVLEDRFRKLNGNYSNASIQNKNALINDLMSENKLF